MHVFRRFGFALTFAVLGAAPAANAEIVALRCTITPERGAAPFSGYVWLDMQNRRAFEQWYPAGGKSPPHFEGPMDMMVMPNEVAIAASPSVKGTIHIDRAGGRGMVTGGRLFCVGSDVRPPPLPAPPAPVPRKSSTKG